jgi:hypothetical protein
MKMGYATFALGTLVLVVVSSGIATALGVSEVLCKRFL